MSFPKAKIHRFNEDINHKLKTSLFHGPNFGRRSLTGRQRNDYERVEEKGRTHQEVELRMEWEKRAGVTKPGLGNIPKGLCPAPGRYDPKFDKKIKGAVIEKGERFKALTKLETASSIESLDSICSTSTNQSVFRTPIMMRKKPVATPRSATYGSNTNIPTKIPVSEPKVKKKLNSLFKSDSEQKLIEQINELARAHTSQLVEKNQEISALQTEIDSLKEKISALDNVNNLKENAIRSEYEMIINKLKQEMENFETILREEKETREKCIEQLYAEIDMIEENFRNSSSVDRSLEKAIEENNECFEEMNEKYSQLEAKFKEAKDEMDGLVHVHKRELESLAKKHGEELKEIAEATQGEVQNMNTRLEDNLRDLEKEFDIIKMELQIGFQQKIEFVIKETKDQTSSFESYMAAFSCKIKDMEVEFNKRISDFENGLKKCREWNDNVFTDYKRTVEESESQKAVILEQKIMIVDLQDKIDRSQEELQKMRKKCRKYEIVHAEITKTVQVLSKRLFESETDVENLNQQRKEMQMKCGLLEEKIKHLIEADKAARANLEDMQMAIVRDVKEIEDQLLAKVDSYRRIAAEEGQKMKKNLEEKQKAIEMLVSEVDFYRGKANESVEVITRFQIKLSECRQEVKEIQVKYSEREEEFNEKINAQRALYESLKEDYDSIKSSTESESEELKNRLQDLNVEKQTFEKRCENDEREIKDLKFQLEGLMAKLEKTETDLKTMNLINSERENIIEELNFQVSQSKERERDNLEEINALMKEREEQGMQIVKLEEKVAEREIRNDSTLSELNECKACIETMTEHIVSVMSELAENARQIEVLNHEVEIKNSTAVQVSEEYEKMKMMYEAQLRRANDLEKDIIEAQQDYDKYIDGLISEVVLEKERCTELTESMNQLKTEKDEQEVELGRLREKIELLQAVVTSQQLKLEEMERNALEKEEESKLVIQSALQAQDDMAQLQERLKVSEHELTALRQEHETLASQMASIAEVEKDSMSLKEINAILTDQNEKLKLRTEIDSTTITSLRAAANDLEMRKRELESIIGPFKQQLMQFEEERGKLLSRTQSTEKELRELELKHAKSLGHQNNKQKIRHVMNLTGTIAEQRMELVKLRTENCQLRQKLGKQVLVSSISKAKPVQTAIDKENPHLVAATASTDTHPVVIKKERHLSPATILKQRNAN